MADRTISLTIGVNDNGSPIIKTFKDNTEQAFQKLTQKSEFLVDSVKKHWLGLTAAAAAAGLAINRAWALADAAAQYQEQKESINALAWQYNTSADHIISSIQSVSKGLISMSDAADIAGNAMVKGLTPEQIINLAGAAETLSNVTGQKVPDALRNMTEGLATGRMRGLEAAVGIIDLKDKYGGLVDKMTDVEKAQKTYAIVMERVNGLQKTLGEGTDSTADKMDRFKVQISDLKLALGGGIIKAVIGLSVAFDWVAGSALTAAQGMAKVFEAANWAQSNMGLTKAIREEGRQAAEYWKQFASDAGEAATDLTERALKNMELLNATSSDVLTAADDKNVFRGGMGGGGNAKKPSGISPPIDFKGSLATSEMADFGAKARLAEQVTGLDLMLSESIQKQDAWEAESLEMTKRTMVEKGGLYRQQFQENGTYMEEWKQFELDSLKAQYDEYSKHVNDKSALDEWYALKKQGIDTAQTAAQIANDKKANEKKLQMQQSLAAATVGVAQALFIATGSKERSLFEFMKAARIGQAIIDTYAGATKAYAQLGAYGWAGAAAIIAAGMANVATIASTEMGGGYSEPSIQTSDAGGRDAGGSYNYSSQQP
ncbi:MAG: hypothetical protein HW415_1426, partial [Deltaproteobacteria bacterium]|nr:hypothetical protein [Deltaproteobacteria bacterium]